MVAAAQRCRLLFEEEENRPDIPLCQAAGGGAGLTEMHVREYGGIEGTNEAFLLWFREGGYTEEEESEVWTVKEVVAVAQRRRLLLRRRKST